MDSFTYTNIFDTKGIEYLAIIAFLLLLIPFWIILNRQAKIGAQITRAIGVLSAGILRIPKGLFHTRQHTWMYLERSGIATVGVDDLLMHITGDMKFRHLVEPGDPVLKGEPMAEFEQEGKKLKVFSPVSGVVKNFNRSLAIDPALLTEDPYGKGWLFRIEPTNWKSDIAPCYISGETGIWFNTELERFKDFIAASVPRHSGQFSTILQDGGQLSERTLAGLPGDVWDDFQKEFLDPTT